jgi:hypothetical protein
LVHLVYDRWYRKRDLYRVVRNKPRWVSTVADKH